MNYTHSLRYLNAFVNLERLSQFPQNPFFNLKRMAHLLKVSGHPEKQFFPILVAGTTGKGSTGFFLESILKANGIRVGYYHSPHVEDPRERIRLQGDMASQQLWAEGLSEIRRLLRAKPLPKRLGVLTYFEIATFLAILIFAKERVRVGIFEIGLGGRLDATNILKAPLVLLTPIHLDHEAFLGNTVRKITAEKAAIIKPYNHIIIGKQSRDALKVICGAVRKNKGSLWKARPVSGVSLGLSGDFQKANAGMAIKAAEILQKYFGFSITPENSIKGLRSGNWKGRMETFHKDGRLFILDGAHNPISVKGLVEALKRGQADFSKVARLRQNRSTIAGKISLSPWLIFGAMNDKNSREMLKILAGRFQNVILTGMNNPRAKSVGMLMEDGKGLFKCVLTAQNTREAMQLFKKAADLGTRAVVTGSFYLVGEARKLLKAGGS